jgi:gamma-glutamyltranspeptidase/glutathione hydrolase
MAELGPDQPEAGDRLRRPGLAKTLARIEKQGAAGFYEGPTARAIVAALGRGGSQMSLEDLASYRAKERKPLRFSYRGYELETMPPPSAGGVALMEILEQLQRLSAWRSPAGSADELHLFLEASRRAQLDKRFRVVDPDSLSPEELARHLASFANVGRLLEHGIDPNKATPSSELHPLYGAAMRELEHTTHFSVVDADGMAVSCTTTLSAGFGAKLVIPGAGIVMNNSVASCATAGENLPAGGRRTISSMAPTLVTRDGKLAMVLGSPGGDTIPSTIAQVFRHLVDHGMPLDRAVDAPRVHHGFVPDEFRYEGARPIAKKVIEDLKARGHHVSKKRLPMGDANDIVLVDGVARGYADRREGGLAAKPASRH